MTPTMTSTPTLTATPSPTETATSTQTPTATPTPENHPPSVLAAVINPDPGIAGQVLSVLGIGFDDFEYAPERYFYSWFVNGKELLTANDGELPAENFTVGDLITARLIPFDGELFGAPVFSDSVRIIGNTFNLTINPEELERFSKRMSRTIFFNFFQKK